MRPITRKRLCELTGMTESQYKELFRYTNLDPGAPRLFYEQDVQILRDYVEHMITHKEYVKKVHEYFGVEKRSR